MVKLAFTACLIAGAFALTSGARPGDARELTGGLSGRVTFTGTVPAPEPIDMSSEQFCQEAQRGAAAVRQRVRVGTQNGLADVIVRVKGVAASASKPAPTEPVVLDQKACAYHPAVLALRVGQPLLIRNSDGVLHNVHAFAKSNAPFNIGQPLAGVEARRTMRVAETIPVRCDIHDWMQANIVVLDDSFFAVTDADGRFTIDALPPGEYEIEAWHPKLGGRTQKVRVVDGAVGEVVIQF
jgi:plastocyanin